MALTVVGYARVSSEDQATSGSIEGQLEYIKLWVAREKWTLIKIYRDDGLSGKDMNRPGLQQLLKESAAGKFQAVICYHNDRLSRDLKNTIEIAQALQKNKVALRCGNLDVDLSSPEGNLMFQLLGGFAEYFRRDLGRKTSLGMRTRAAAGFHMGRIGSHFILVKGRLQVKPESRSMLFNLLQDRSRHLSYEQLGKKYNLGPGISVYRIIKSMQRIGINNATDLDKK